MTTMFKFVAECFQFNIDNQTLEEMGLRLRIIGTGKQFDTTESDGFFILCATTAGIL